MQHLCLDRNSNLILNGKSSDKDLVYMKRFIRFVTYLFDLELVLKFQFSFVI